MKYHGYADDNQLYLVIKQAKEISDVKTRVQDCVSDINIWMCQNKLKLNEGKTEIICFSGKKHIRELFCKTSFTFGGKSVIPVKKVKDLGVYLDEKLSMKDHITYIEKTCNYQLRNIARNRQFLTTEVCKTLVHSLITSRLDYCNSLLTGLSQTSLQPLERIQNRAVKLVAKCNKFDHVTPLLKEYHWLPIKQRIDYKILLMVFKARSKEAPSYLESLLQPYTSQKSGMRVTGRPDLAQPKAKGKTYGHRSFRVAGPTLWNAIPAEVRNSTTVAIFKKRLKTFLFSTAFK